MRIPCISLKTLLVVAGVLAAVPIALDAVLFPEPPEEFSPTYFTLDQSDENPPGSLCWFQDSSNRPVVGFAIFGQSRPQVWASVQRGDIKVPSRGSSQTILPRDGHLYILDPSFTFQRTTVQIDDVAKNWADYDHWARPIADQIKTNTWP